MQKEPRKRLNQARRPEIRFDFLTAVENPGQRLARLLAEIVEHRGLTHAGDGAERRATLRLRSLALDVFHRVLFERNARTPPLLGTIVDQALLANVDESASRAAVPGVGDSTRDVLLKAVEMRKRKQRSFELPETVVNILLGGRERFQLSFMVVQNSDRAGEPQLTGAR